MIDIIKAKEIFFNIYSDNSLIELLVEYITVHEKQIERYLKIGRTGNWTRALRKDAFFKLCLTFAYLPICKEMYDRKGINSKVFYDTMSDIKIWIDDYRDRCGKYGLAEFNWIVNHLNISIFRLGRLQFHLTHYYFGIKYSEKQIDIKLGDPVLNIHIPRGEKLSIDACKQSLVQSKTFFTEYFPKYPTNIYICHSWLLYSENKKYMSSESNIIKFASMFNIVGETESPSQTFLWLFNMQINSRKLMKNKKKNGIYYPANQLQNKQSLQISAINHMTNGGKFGDAKGVLLFDNVILE